MMIFFQEIIALLPVIVLCMTALFVLFFILIYRGHGIIFFTTILGISLSCFSLCLVWKSGIQKVTDLLCIDGFSFLCMILVLFASFLITIISRIWLSYSCSSSNYDEFYLLLLIFSIGSMIVINASHVVTLFFGIELLSLPLFGLMGYFNLKYSLEATIKYLVLSGVSTAFLLFGIALVYAETTHLSFFDIHLSLLNKPYLSQSMLLMSGIVMMLVGFGFKLSLVPFHLWTGDVYHGVPEIAGMCLSTINKVSIFSVLTRFFLLFPEYYRKVNYVLVLIACFSILFGNVMAIKQNNMKRILAYSSVAHMGYLLIAVSATIKEFSEDSHHTLSLLTNGIEAISIGLINYLFATLAIFGVLCLLFCCSYKNSNMVDDVGDLFLYRGLFWRDPILAIVITIIMLSLSGIPLTLGFISKFYLIVLSVKNELLWCVAVVIVGTVIGMLYYLRIITVLYLSVFPKKIKNLGLLLYGVVICRTQLASTAKYYDNRWFLNSSSVIILFISLFLLFFGICPQFLIDLFVLTQKNF